METETRYIDPEIEKQLRAFRESQPHITAAENLAYQLHIKTRDDAVRYDTHLRREITKIFKHLKNAKMKIEIDMENEK